MKKTVYALLTVVLFATYSCKKNTEGNAVTTTDQKETENNGTPDSTIRYVAEDGSSALVTFITEDGGKSVSVRSNNKIITAPWKSEGVYSNYDFEIVAKNDSVTITQGNNVIRLKKARGQ